MDTTVTISFGGGETMADDYYFHECGCVWEYNDFTACIIVPCEFHRKKYNLPKEVAVSSIKYFKEVRELSKELHKMKIV
jgi:hypothetical protein